MARELNFNTVQRPEMLVTLKDNAQTQLHLIVPSLALVEELQAVTGTNDAKLLVDLSARLLSHNTEEMTITTEDLTGKYRFGYDDLLIFFEVYVDFLADLKNAKN